MEGISTGQMAIIIINGLLTVAGFVIALMIKRLYVAIDSLGKKDSELQKDITEHREDMLGNYVSTKELSAFKEDIFRRLDRFEDTALNAIRRINQS